MDRRTWLRRAARAGAAASVGPFIGALPGCGGGHAGPGGDAQAPRIDAFEADADRYFIGDTAKVSAFFLGLHARLLPDGPPVRSGEPVHVGPLAGPCTLQLQVTASDGRTARAELRLDVGYRGRWRSLPMGAARAAHAGVALADGRIALFGGEGPLHEPLPRQVLAFDPTQRAFGAIGELLSLRVAHTATALPDGRVLVVGAGAPGAPHGELFDPSSGRSLPAPIRMPRSHHTATLLRDGRVLLVGGHGVAGDSVELFDPRRDSSRLWPAALGVPRLRHVASCAAAGGVLIHGGATTDGRAPMPELIDVAGERCVPLPWPDAESTPRRVGHAAVPMPDGRLCITGGEDAVQGEPTASTLLVDADGRYAAGPPMTLRRSGHALVPLGDGRMLAIGGRGAPAGVDWVASCEVLESVPACGWRSAGLLAEPRLFHSAHLLRDGRVLVVGGNNRSRHAIATAELFD